MMTLEDLRVQLSKVVEPYQVSYWGWPTSKIFSQMVDDVLCMVTLSYGYGYSVKDVIKAQEEYEEKLENEKREREKHKGGCIDIEPRSEQFHAEEMEQFKDYINSIIRKE